MKIIKKRLYESEGLATGIRWDETCECVQSFDGTTWVDNPMADPRYNPANLAPPNGEADPRCSAALGMRNKIENILDAFFLASSLIDAANAILALITVTVPGVGLIWRVIFAVCEALYAIGSAALISAFTEEAFDELQCIFYNNIGDDGQMSEAQLSATNTQICEDMDITVCAAMGLLLNMLGWVGMSNAGAQFAEVGDCDPCGWCYEFDFTEDDGGFTTFGVGTWSSAGWETGLVYVGGDPARGRRQVQLTKSFGFSVTATKIQMVYSAAIGNNTAPTGTGMWKDTFATTIQTAGVSSGLNTITFNGSMTLDNIQLSLGVGGCDDCGDPGGSGEIRKLRFYGAGTNPFGDDNCAA